MHSATFTDGARCDEEVNSATATVTVLDTSVLVADPDIVNSSTAALVVPLTVIEELDDLKSRDGDVGQAARSAVRNLEGLGMAGGSGAATNNAGGTVRIELNGVHLDTLRTHHLDVRKADNRIIGAALGLAAGGAEVRLLSADTALRVKAAALGLSSAEHLPGPATSRTAGEVVRLDTDRDTIDALFDDHQLGITAVPGADSLGENTFGALSAGSQSVLVRRVGDTLRQVRTDRSAWGMRSRSRGQTCALELLMDPEVPVVSLQGHAGTGKTMLALAAGLEQVFESTGEGGERYDRMMIVRPIVPVGQTELGFLPGDLEEKLGPWFEAIVDTLVALGSNVTHREAKAMLDGWTHEGRLSLESVAHVRGRSLQRTYLLSDETQNYSPQVIKTLLTRLGEGSKIALIGDVSQIDSPFLSERTNALSVLTGAFAGSSLYGHVTLDKGERSPVADLAASRL